MAATCRGGAVLGLCLVAMVVVGSIGAQAQLSTQFYDDKCPQVFEIVKAEIQTAVAAEARMAASLVRLHFHDCFVQGCDGSILLNSTPGTNDTEKIVTPNLTIRGFDVIDTIKAKVEAACPQIVSCADIVAIASRDSAVEAGLSPGYAVFVGRRDSLKAAKNTTVSQFLPSPFMDYPALKQNFANVGLDEVDLVTLSGGHTIGRVHCSLLLLPGLANNNTVGFNPTFHQNNLDACSVPDNATKLLNLDPITPDFLDNWYFKNLLNGLTNLVSDQVLFITPGGISQPLVTKYAFDQAAFEEQFGVSTIKMGNISPLTGDEGEIRLNCAVPNDASAPNVTSPKRSAPSLVASQ